MGWVGLVFFVSYIWLIFSHGLFFFTSKLPLFVRPFSIILLFSFVKTVPYSLLSFYFPSVVRDDVLVYITTDNLPLVIVLFNFMYGAFILLAGFSYGFFGGGRAEVKLFDSVSDFFSKISIGYINLFVFVCFSILFFYLKMQAIGGLGNSVFGGDLDRGTVTVGIGYVLGLADITLALCCVFSLVKYKKSESAVDLVLFLFVLVFCVFSFSLLGGRKALLQHLIVLSGFWVFLGGRIKVFSIQSALIGLFGALYFMIVLELRLTDVEKGLLFQFSDFGHFEPLVKFFVNFSYNEIYYFIIYHFNEARVFWGAIYLDLLSAPLPAAWFPDKAPIDEGVYIKALMVGVDVVPGMAATEFRGLGSMPPETFGNAIMNFGLFSIFLFGPIYGFLVAKLLDLLNKWRLFGLFSVYFLYQFIINIQLSNLRVVGLLTVLVICFGCFLIYRVLGFVFPVKAKAKGI